MYNSNLNYMHGQGLSQHYTAMYSSFTEKFSSKLQATSGELDCSKRSPLSSVILKDDPRRLTEHNSHWLSHQERLHGFDFSNRFDAEEVEWRLNQPLEIIDGRTCVHLEVLAHRPDNLASLMRHGGSPNVKDATCGQSPLHYACANKAVKGRHTILKVLLHYGGDLYQRDNTGRTPISDLQLVDSALYTSIVQDYLYTNCQVDDFRTVEKLHEIAQQNGPLEDFRQLYSCLSHGNSRSTDLGLQTLLFRTCKEGWIDGVSFILSETEEVPLANRITNETPLHAACEGNHYEVVVQLITKFPQLLLIKDKLPYRGWYPIHTACAYGASDKVLNAVLVGMSCLMDEPLYTNVDVHIIDELGRSPLYIAAKCDNISHINLMTLPCLFNTLQHCVPSLYAITFSNVSQISVIHCAIAHDRRKSLQLLLDKFPLAIDLPVYPTVFLITHMLSHIRRNIKDFDSKLVIYPLLESTICERDDGKITLLSTKMVFDHYGILSNLLLSPLGMAVAMGNTEITEMLLAAGAKDDDGLALRVAIFLKYHEIARMLLITSDDASLCLANSKKLSTFTMPSRILNDFIAIDLQHNCLDSVPLALFQISGLQSLNLSYNRLTKLPLSDISSSDVLTLHSLGSWKCRSIEVLDISYNALESLPAVLWKLPELNQLHAQHNSITIIKTNAEIHHWLEEINVSHNNLQSAPECVFRATTVDVSHNKLKCLPMSIWKLDGLRTLLASSNQLAEITFPKSLCNSSRDRRSSSFTSKGKRKLSAEGNPSFFIHKKGTNEVYESYLCGLSKLDLSHNKLTSFPTNLACFASNLQRLHISGNNISMLYICLLPPCIKHLDAGGCNLDWIETSYDNSSHLCCHKTHTSLSNLSYLYLKGNIFKQFTFIDDSPDADGKTLRFPELITLDLSNNRLSNQLDENIGLQKNLTTLILSNNPDLKSLPLELSYLSNTLTHLELHNLTGLKDPPKEYILAASRSPIRLLSYMKSRMTSSVQYRMLDLIIVGGNKKGKTSLVKGLNRKLKKNKFPTDEISICNWKYSPPSGDGPDVVFRIWDFPSQHYDTTVNYHFYSKQAVYIATFNLTDGERGVRELNVFLRNIKAHAPGCPVMIVGTHLDAVSVKEDDISQTIERLYSDPISFPTIAGVSCVSNTERIHGRMKTLRHSIYCVAMNLHTNRKNKLTLKNGKPLDDPDALLQQYIPKSYLSLQYEVESKISELKQKNVAPMMSKTEFQNCFQSIIEDEEELVSAVQFLHRQRRLLHFEDSVLDAYYFLDLQWIFNTMMNIMRIPDSNAMILKDKLIAQSTLMIPEPLQSGFLALLAKFDFAIPFIDNHVLIHGLLPKQSEYPVNTATFDKKSSTLVKKMTNFRKTIKKRIMPISKISPEVPDVIVYTVSDSSDDAQDDNVNTNKTVDLTGNSSDHPANEGIESKQDNIDGIKQLNEIPTSYKLPTSLPIMHKRSVCQHESFPQLSLVDTPAFDSTSDLSSPHEMPSFNGFSLKATYSHPVLHPNLCRVWLASFVPDGFWPQLFTRIISDNRIKSVLSTLLFTALKNNECTLDYASTDLSSVWKLYQMGFAIEHEDTTLIQLKQVPNKLADNGDDKFANQFELTIYICETVLMYKTYKESASQKSTENVIRLATSILVLIEQHILDIGEEWFPGVLCCNHNKEVLSFVPCSSCLLQTKSQNTLHSASTSHQILSFDDSKAICFSLKDLLVAYAQPSRSIKCPLHNEIHVQQLAPDMCFKDLEEDIVCGPDIPLKIDKDKQLGQGGQALVLRGEIMNTNLGQQRKLVAVKIITDELHHAKKFTDFLNSYITSVKGYRMIRKEVLFLSTLRHQNLTQLCGVSTHPFMLLIELAPLGSLGSILKQYRAANQVLTPAVLQASMHQVASAIAFLHEKHVVYLDLKSDNVLVWKFPLPGHHNTDQHVLLKITDYGISRIAGATNEIRSSSITGTPGFIAPELYKEKRQDLKSDKIDVFSFGMFLYELLTLLKPFELHADNPVNLIRKEKRPQIPKSKEKFTPCLFQFIMEACWNQDPKERPSMAQIVEWSLLPELKHLRIQYHLNPTELLSVGHCVVLRDHLHQCATSKPLHIQYTIPNCEHYTSLFSSISAQTPSAKRKENTASYHSQVWIAQKNEDVTSKLTIFTFRSSDLGYYVHKDDTTSKVVSMENVGNYMWVNTTDRKLHIIHTATMKTVACVTLKNSLLEVVQMLHVPEWHMVLVLWELPEIWCLHDEIDASGLHVIGSLQLKFQNNPIYNLCKVTLNTTTEVWATRKDKEIAVLTETSTGCVESNTLRCTINSNLPTINCNLISCLRFNTKCENSLIHVWITFEESPQLICWNAENKNQLHSVSLHSENCKATSLLGCKNRLYVGTSIGTVEVFESESGRFLQQFSWHSNVNVLLELPQDIKQCICAESSSTKCVKLSHHQSFMDNPIISKRRISQEAYLQRSASGSQLPFNSKSYKSGLYSTPPQSTLLQESPLIVSLGNDLADQLNISSNHVSMSQNVELLTWTGFSNVS